MTKNKLSFLIAFISMCMASLITAEPLEKRLSLQEAVQTGLSRNYDVLINQLSVQQVLKQKEKALSSFFPQLSANFVHSQMDEERAELQATASSSGKWNLTLQQVLYNAEAISVFDQTNQSLLLARKNADYLKESITEKIILAYVELLKARNILKAQKINLQNYSHLKDLADLRYRLQDTSRRDLLLVEMEYNNARVSLLNAEETVKNAEKSLNLLLREEAGTEVAVIEVDQMDPFLWSSQQNHIEPVDLLEADRLRNFLKDRALNQSLEVQIAEEQKKLAQMEKDSVTAQFQPSVSASATWFQQTYAEYGNLSETQKERYDDLNEKGWNASLTVSVPLFEGGGRFKALSEKEFKVLEKQKALEQTKAAVTQETYQLETSHYLNLERETETRSVYEKAKENLKLGEIAYKEGSLSIMDLLDIQSAKITHEINAITRKYQSRSSLAKLLRQTGHLSIMLENKSANGNVSFTNQINNLVQGSKIARK